MFISGLSQLVFHLLTGRVGGKNCHFRLRSTTSGTHYCKFPSTVDNFRYTFRSPRYSFFASYDAMNELKTTRNSNALMRDGSVMADSDLVDFLSGPTDSAINFNGSADLHTPIHPPRCTIEEVIVSYGVTKLITFITLRAVFK